MEKQDGDGIAGDLTLSAFRILANGVRKFIKGSRPLEDGELHFLGANFMGQLGSSLKVNVQASRH